MHGLVELETLILDLINLPDQGLTRNVVFF